MSVSGPKLDVVVTGIRQLTPRIREYLLTASDRGKLPRYEPGSHIELHLWSDESGSILRHYSLVGGVGSWDDPPHTYRIAVQLGGGRGSRHIHDRFALGTALKISVPRKQFPARSHGHT
jgi:ferredoxin-NADP reductase